MLQRFRYPSTQLLKSGWRAFAAQTAPALKESEELTFEVAHSKRSAESDAFCFQVQQFKGHRIDPPDNIVTTTKQELIESLRTMQIMRNMEMRAHTLYQGKQIRGFCHLYDGQEAIVVGMELAIKKTDSVITSYRDHCTHIARGGTVKEVLSELFGRADGCSKGKKFPFLF